MLFAYRITLHRKDGHVRIGINAPVLARFGNNAAVILAKGPCLIIGCNNSLLILRLRHRISLARIPGFRLSTNVKASSKSTVRYTAKVGYAVSRTAINWRSRTCIKVAQPVKLPNNRHDLQISSKSVNFLPGFVSAFETLYTKIQSKIMSQYEIDSYCKHCECRSPSYPFFDCSQFLECGADEVG